MYFDANNEFTYDERFTPDSSMLDELYYDGASRELVVKFVNGSLRIYSPVSKDTWNGLKNAMSAGVYYNRLIKNNGYSSVSLGDTYFTSKVQDVSATVESTEAESTPVINVTVNVYVNGDAVAAMEAVNSIVSKITSAKGV